MIITVIVILPHVITVTGRVYHRSSHAVCLGMSNFVKRHLSLPTVSGSGIPLFSYRRLIKYHVFSLSLSYSTCFSTVAVCSTGPPPIGIVDLISISYDTRTLFSTYKHFPSPVPQPAFNDSINDRLHGWNVSMFAVISMFRASDNNNCRHSSPFAVLYFYLDFRPSPRVVVNVCYYNNNIDNNIIHTNLDSWSISDSKCKR